LVPFCAGVDGQNWSLVTVNTCLADARRLANADRLAVSARLAMAVRFDDSTEVELRVGTSACGVAAL